MNNFLEKDFIQTMQQKFFEHALQLAQKALGHTSPNPCVGAVVVKNGEIIGEGYHKKAGSKHAEVVAIENAVRNGFSVEGADVYVTLEPCCHVGKTSACTELLINSKIKRVFVGMKDPFKLVNGGGIKVLKRAGVEVEVLPKYQDLTEQIRFINQPFIKWALTGLPYVTLKAAVSLDGRIATRTNDSKWITSDEARIDSKRERSMCDAVLVGSGTAKKDNPELAPHGKFTEKQLKRILIDPDLSTPLSFQIFRDSNVFVATTHRADKEKQAEFATKNIPVEPLGVEKIEIKHLLQHLGKIGVQHLFVEGGSSVHGSFFDEAIYDPLVIDRIVWYIAPKFIGGREAICSISGTGIEKITQARSMENVRTELVGPDIKVSGYLNVY